MADKNMFKKWKTSTCFEGSKCWCRLVVTEDYTKKNDKIEDCITASGDLTKEMAKHFVELHNKWLEEKNND